MLRIAHDLEPPMQAGELVVGNTLRTVRRPLGTGAVGGAAYALRCAVAGATVVLRDVPEGSYVAIPSIDGLGVKIGRSATEWGTDTTASTIRCTVDDGEVAMMRTALDTSLLGAAGAEHARSTCVCTYISDGHPIIDQHPEHAAVSIACGFSGRGYKFAPLSANSWPTSPSTAARATRLGLCLPGGSQPARQRRAESVGNWQSGGRANTARAAR